MPRIALIDPARAMGKTKQLLDEVRSRLGVTPNLVKAFAHSPAALEAYLKFSTDLSRGMLSTQFREQIALAVAQANSCAYCLSAHTTLGSNVGLSPTEIEASRACRSADEKEHASLQLAQAIVIQRGEVSAAIIEKPVSGSHGPNRSSFNFTDNTLCAPIEDSAGRVFSTPPIVQIIRLFLGARSEPTSARAAAAEVFENTPFDRFSHKIRLTTSSLSNSKPVEWI